MNETFVSYKVARLLKEKGFRGECFKVYTLKGELLNASSAYNIGVEEFIVAPTHNLALRWVREALGIFVEITPVLGTFFPHYTLKLINLKEAPTGGAVTSFPHTCDTWETATEVGLREALTL